jgi:hypothetical protein
MSLLLKVKIENNQTGAPISLIADADGKQYVNVAALPDVELASGTQVQIDGTPTVNDTAAQALLAKLLPAVSKPGALVAPVSLSAANHADPEVTGCSGVTIIPALGTTAAGIVWACVDENAAAGGTTLANLKPITHAKDGIPRWLPVDPAAEHQYLHLLFSDATYAAQNGGAADIVCIGKEIPAS